MTNEEIFKIADATGAPEGDIAARHPSVQQVLRWFTYEHLPHATPRRVSVFCAELAGDMLGEIPVDDPELTAGLRKLLEAKDCFVRAAIAAQSGSDQ